MDRCGTCHHPALTLDPCPCRLGPECPVTHGVCPSCWRIIRANAAGRLFAPRPLEAATSVA
jgi:hypothetical protein